MAAKESAVARWYVDIRDENGATHSLKDVSIAKVKTRVADKQPGETITFTPPNNVTLAEIDELVRRGARKLRP